MCLQSELIKLLYIDLLYFKLLRVYHAPQRKKNKIECGVCQPANHRCRARCIVQNTSFFLTKSRLEYSISNSKIKNDMSMCIFWLKYDKILLFGLKISCLFMILNYFPRNLQFNLLLPVREKALHWQLSVFFCFIAFLSLSLYPLSRSGTARWLFKEQHRAACSYLPSHVESLGATRATINVAERKVFCLRRRTSSKCETR